MVVYIFNPSTWEVEAGEFKPSLVYIISSRASGGRGLHNKRLSQEKENRYEIKTEFLMIFEIT